MVGFLTGEPGSGKTTYIYKTITKRAEKEPFRKFFLFVPEQNTLKAQQELIKASERHGILNIDVLSFELLCYRVMSELGLEPPALLDEVMRSMFMRRAARETVHKLKVYGKKIDQRGFTCQLKNIYSEFRQYQIDDKKLEEMIARTDTPLLKGKLEDIRTIFAAFDKALEGRAASREDLPYYLLKCIHKSGLLKDAVIYFDGFTGFTPIQLSLLEHIIPSAAECRFAVTIPGEEAGKEIHDPLKQKTDLYRLSRETIRVVSLIGEKSGMGCEEPLKFKNVFAGPEIRIRSASDPETEVRQVCHCLRQLCITGEEKIRFRNAAVAVTDMAAYREMLGNSFTAEGLPYFMDERSPASVSAAVSLILTALRAIAGGYRYEDVIAYVRNPLFMTEKTVREKTDLFDNMLRARGVRGRKNMEKMTDLLEPDTLPPLLRLHDRLTEGRSVAEKARAVRQFLEETAMEEKTGLFCERLKALGLEAKAGENDRFRTQVCLYLDRMEELLGSEKTGIKEFYAMVSAGFEDLDAGLLPAGADVVQIGDLKRSRFEDIDVLFIVGANEGKLPKTVVGGGIFTDRERLEIMKQGVEMAPDDASDSLNQEFYLFNLMKKPRRLLVISSSAEDGEGSRLRPAAVLRTIRNAQKTGEQKTVEPKTGEREGTEFSEKKEGTKKAFENKTTVFGKEGTQQALENHWTVSVKEDPKPMLENPLPVSVQEAYRQITELLAAGKYDSPLLLLSGAALLKLPGEREKFEKLLDSVFISHEHNRLDGETARQLYGEILAGSVTRLERFKECPYSYFLNYGLELKDRERFRVEAVDIGILLHEAIDVVFRRAEEEGMDLRDMEEQRLRQEAKTAVQEAAAQYHDGIFSDSYKNRFIRERLEQLTEKTLRTLSRQLKKGDYRTAGTEKKFVLEEKGLRLYGRIDRIDVYEDGDNQYIRVIDYKTGSQSFDLSMTFQGYRLQLCTYLEAAEEKLRSGTDKSGSAAEKNGPDADKNRSGADRDEAGEDKREAGADKGRVIPAGMFYYHIHEPVTVYEKGMTKETAELENEKKLMLNGIVNSEGPAALHMDRVLEEAGKAKSDVIRAKTVDGVVQEDEGTLTGRQLEMLLRHVRSSREETAGQIRSGEIDCSPAVFEKAPDACSRCEFHSICGFDTALPGFSARRIPRLSKEEIVAKLEQPEQTELPELSEQPELSERAERPANT